MQPKPFASANCRWRRHHAGRFPSVLILEPEFHVRLQRRGQHIAAAIADSPNLTAARRSVLMM
jgi:hypothetical protein